VLLRALRVAFGHEFRRQLTEGKRDSDVRELRVCALILTALGELICGYGMPAAPAARGLARSPERKWIFAGTLAGTVDRLAMGPRSFGP
jgi:hypothetical protein